MYENDSESIKIKGFDNKYVNFNDLKNKFYSDEYDMKINENNSISKKNMKLFNIKINKKLSIKNYDKRVFIDNYKNTRPLFLDKYIIYK
jgi:hypothetical protein